MNKIYSSSLMALCLFLVACEDSSERTAKKSEAVATVQSAESDKSSGLKSACDVFPLDIAQHILGDNVEKGHGSQPDSYDEQLKVRVSTCTYQADDPNSAGILVASLSLRAAGSDKQRADNEALLELGMQAFESDDFKVENINGLGDKAYAISSSLGEFIHMLANDNQYMLIVSAQTREQTEELVRLVQGNL